tara:strand:- start:208 stop:693 length:486 start_codon:yes stop_codon:yes gene_type:complete
MFLEKKLKRNNVKQVSNQKMELQALLLSKSIPNDIVVNEIYNHLWRNKKVFNQKQKEAIVHDHFHLKKIIQTYLNDTSLSENKESMDYFLCWLYNDMLSVLNDDYAYIDGLSLNLKKECPDISKEWLLSLDNIDDLPDKIYTIWKMMTTNKKNIMYERTTP